MATHVKVIAAIFMVLGAFWALLAVLGPAILAMVAGVVSTSGDPDAAVGTTILGFAGVAFAIFAAVLAAAFIATGWGLLKLKSWARIAAIVMAAICLTNVPIGTVFGIYALIILFKKETEALFARVPLPPSPTVNT